MKKALLTSVALPAACCCASCNLTLDAGDNAGTSVDPGVENYGGSPAHYWNLNPPSHELRDNCKWEDLGTYNGSWRGDFTDKVLPSGSAAIHLRVEYTNQEGICGKMTFGAGVPPPLPTDPTAPYPPSDAATSYTDATRLVEGFPYQVAADPSAMAGHASSFFRAPILLHQPWKAWCEIQNAYPSSVEFPGTSLCHCLPPHDVYEVAETGCTVDTVPTSCTQVNLCIVTPICSCSQHGCTVDTYNPFFAETATNLRFDGDTATGTLVLLDGAHSFTLTRER